MAYELDVSSESTKTSADLENNQLFIIVDASTNRAKIIAKDSAGDAIDVYLRSSKRYVALLTQSGGSAPVATVLENDLGEVPTYGRTSAGLFTVNTTTKFAASKTTIKFGTVVPVDDIASVEAVMTSTSVITFKTKNYKTSDDTAGVLDGLLTNTVIEIEVFP